MISRPPSTYTPMPNKKYDASSVQSVKPHSIPSKYGSPTKTDSQTQVDSSTPSQQRAASPGIAENSQVKEDGES